jgi:hypothetical protein
MEAIPFFSVISLHRLGGAPDLRAACVFGQRLGVYHPFGGSVVVFYFALAPREKGNPASDQRVGKSVAAYPKT